MAAQEEKELQEQTLLPEEWGEVSASRHHTSRVRTLVAATVVVALATVGVLNVRPLSERLPARERVSQHASFLGEALLPPATLTPPVALPAVTPPTLPSIVTVPLSPLTAAPVTSLPVVAAPAQASTPAPDSTVATTVASTTAVSKATTTASKAATAATTAATSTEAPKATPDPKVVAAQAAKKADKEVQLAQTLQGQSDDLKGKADKVQKQENTVLDNVKDLKKQADTDVTKAAAARKHAEDLKAQVAKLTKQANDEITKASKLDKDAENKKTGAGEKQKEADVLAGKVADLQKQSDDKNKQAVHTEKTALDHVKSARMCIKLPGVQLKGESPATYDPLVGKQNATDEWQCTDWCQKHAKCQQSVFDWETNSCQLYEKRTQEPVQFRDRWPFFNSSYCGSLDEKSEMLKMLHAVYDAKPYVPPPHNCSWAGENCLETACCADMCKASWDFTTCADYTCYKKDEYFATCHLGGPPAGWDGYKLGGHPNTEIAPAPKGKLVQGTRLYCFTVVMWNQPPAEGWMSSEAELVNHWKDQKKGIVQCDDWSLFDGQPTGSVHNIGSFVNAWNLVKKDGRWKNNDWTLKVDGDAVFFPDHFRSKVQWSLRTPQGSAVYLRNTFYKFQFLGALEALTREATAMFLERGWECEKHLTQEGGEDYWLEQCLEGLGIDYQTDVTLLHDKYAADLNCGDPNNVASHFFKKIDGGDGWDACWDQANEAWNNAHPS